MKSTPSLVDKYDVCVIGAGPAGIIFALEFTKLNPDRTLLLIEFGINGKRQPNELDDSIFIKNTVNHHLPYDCTNKGLGGSSISWGGRCVMYDEIDFIDRSILNGGCTWPYSLFSEVKSYTGKAAEYFECGDPLFDLSEITGLSGSHIAENFVEGIVTDSRVERWSKPTRFAKRYEGELLGRKNLTLIRGFQAKHFMKPDNAGNVSELELEDLRQKKQLKVRSGVFVIAAGAQETTRLLLSNPQLFANLEHIPYSLGRYYQGHLSGKIASVIFNGNSRKTDYGFLRDSQGVYLRRRFQFSTKFISEQNLLNTAIWLDNPLYYDPGHRSGAMSFMYLAMTLPFLGKRLAPPAIRQSITKGKVTGLGLHLRNIIRDLPGSLVTPALIFFKRYCLKRKLPGVFLFSSENKYALHFHSEQIPVAENAMQLSENGKRLEISYTLTNADIQSVIKLHEVLDNWLQETGCGRLEYWYKKEELTDVIRSISRDGIHQSGTTRIAASAENGVVDDQLKLWGTNNVFVCSSSVFPTSGQANPTFFLGAFAARLATHLSEINMDR